MGINQQFDLRKAQPLAGSRASGEPSKLLGLELLRFASALAVLVYHYRHFARLAGMPDVHPASVPLYSLLRPLYEYGQFGVQVFWGISGYIFFWKYGSAIHSRAVAARDFFWLRFSRLYPLHIVTLATVVGLQAVHRQIAGFDFVYPAQDAGLFLGQLLLATDWASPAPFSFNGPIWSISAEVAVYAGFFLLLRRFPPTGGLCLAVMLAGINLQLAGLDWVPISCATFFFGGGLAARAPAKAVRPAAVALAGLVGLCAIKGILGDYEKLPIILVVAVPCLLILLSRDWPVLRRWHGPIQAAGNLTYSSYLLHFPLQLLLAIGVAASGWIPPMSAGWLLATYLGVSLAVAALSYRWFELPAQHWLRRRTLKRAG